MTQDNRVKLRGFLEQTTSWAYIREDGSLVVELYDYSEAAQTHLGNDVAFLLVVAAQEKARVWSLLSPSKESGAESALTALTLLTCLQARFADYYAVKEWCIQYAIPHELVFDSWA